MTDKFRAIVYTYNGWFASFITENKNAGAVLENLNDFK